MEIKLNSKTIYLRLVEDVDASFICSIRNNPELNKHISQSTADVEEQRKWILNYKKRENEGTEYYFIICRLDSDENIGTVRLYDFRDNPKSFCWGSWILNDRKTKYAAVESALLVYEFGFNKLNFEQSHFDVRKENINVNNFHKRFGALLVDDNEIDNFYIYSKEKYKEILPDYNKFL